MCVGVCVRSEHSPPLSHLTQHNNNTGKPRETRCTSEDANTACSPPPLLCCLVRAVTVRSHGSGPNETKALSFIYTYYKKKKKKNICTRNRDAWYSSCKIKRKKKINVIGSLYFKHNYTCHIYQCTANDLDFYSKSCSSSCNNTN